jgi:uncharacterized protein with NRDE domain
LGVCLVALALSPHLGQGPDLRLAIAANRDEFFGRPTAPLGAWPADARIHGGRDLEKGGSWLGLRNDGRFALVTNHRDLRRSRRDNAPSRGTLISAFLETDIRPDGYVEAIRARGAIFEPFNLIVGDLENGAVWYSNVSGESRLLEPGRIYGLSNAFLDTPWPKVERLRAEMQRALASPGEPAELEARLFAALADRTEAPRDQLPDTGTSQEVEEALSCAFIRMPGYGTRSSSIITVDKNDCARFVERTFDESEREPETRAIELRLAATR